MKTYKNILFLSFWICTTVCAQDRITNVSSLKGTTQFYNAVDQWVIWNTNTARNEASYGFLYLDNTAGFTYHYVGTARLVNGRLENIETTLGYTSIKARIEPTTAPIFVLTSEMIKDLELPNEPAWLSTYKSGSDSVNYLKNEGYHYNHVGASQLALEPLLKAYNKEPHYTGLEFELGYAYNALGQYAKAVEILEKAIAHNPDHFYFYKELGFAYRYLKQIDKASKIYKKGISISDNDFEKSEMAVNMAQHYFLEKEKKPFKKWAKLVRKYSKKGEAYAKYIDTFEKEWDNDKIRNQ